MPNAKAELARSIAEEQGFLWKVWIENSDAREAVGVNVRHFVPPPHQMPRPTGNYARPGGRSRPPLHR
ncbi:YdhR family protein [Marinobacter alexandrii]|nr:YdhR family protein [Marinobacter alexandrii]